MNGTASATWRLSISMVIGEIVVSFWTTTVRSPSARKLSM